MNIQSLRKLYNVRNLSENYAQMNISSSHQNEMLLPHITCFQMILDAIELDIYSYPKIQTYMGQSLSTQEHTPSTTLFKSLSFLNFLHLFKILPSCINITANNTKLEIFDICLSFQTILRCNNNDDLFGMRKQYENIVTLTIDC